MVFARFCLSRVTLFLVTKGRLAEMIDALSGMVIRTGPTPASALPS